MNLFHVYSEKYDDSYYRISDNKERIYLKHKNLDIEITDLGKISKEEIEVFKKFKVL